MKTIFDCETEVGLCDSRVVGGTVNIFEADENAACRVCAHTRAYLNGTKGMLRIEQRCFVRLGEEIPEQPWIKPEMVLEPVHASEKAMVRMAKRLHQQYIQKVRKDFPEY